MGLKKVTFSQSLNALSSALARDLERGQSSPLDEVQILVPSTSLKSWLSTKLVEHSSKHIVAGCPIYSLSEWKEKELTSSPNFEKVFLTLYEKLPLLDSSEVKHYLKEDKKKQIDLAEHLTPIFLKYFDFYGDFSLSPWQEALFLECIETKRFQTLSQSFQKPSSSKIYCFGFDFLAPSYWKALFLHEQAFFYLFSPCLFFWQDLCTHFEKKRLSKKLVKNEKLLSEIFSYLDEAPSLLANLSRVGRETLKVFDAFDLEIEDHYTLKEPSSLLEEVQNLVLQFEKQAKIPFEQDGSIEVLLTGPSIYREVESIGEKVLFFREQGVLFSEMMILCPDLNRYSALFSLIFPSLNIPYRMFGVEVGKKNLRLQALYTLLDVLHSGWDLETLSELFEHPAFYEKVGLDAKDRKLAKKWIPIALEEGLQPLFDQWIQFSEEFEEYARLEKFIEIFASLLKKRGKEEKTLEEWALFLEEISQEFLDAEDGESAVFSFIKTLKKNASFFSENRFPFDLIFRLLKKPVLSQVHGSELHTVKIAEISEGALEEKKVIFLLGMDQESFPKNTSTSSLNDLPKAMWPSPSDLDRYFFLQTLFAAEKYLIFSYGHISKKEGKPIGPSRLLLELFEFIDAAFEKEVSQLLIQEVKLSSFEPVAKIPSVFTAPLPEIDTEEEVIAIQDLAALAKNPWKFFLKKQYGIRWKDAQEPSFALQRSQLFREEMGLFSFQDSTLEGILERALAYEVEEEKTLRDEFLKNQGVRELFSYALLETCRETKEGFELPPLSFCLNGNKRIKIVGELKLLSSLGFVSLGSDDFEGILRVWPEWLLASLILEKEEIFCLKTKRIRSLKKPKEALEAYLHYFLLASQTPSPFFPQFAKAILQGDGAFEKKQTTFFQDPLYEWVCQRFELPTSSQIQEIWQPTLLETFEELMQLFPKMTHAKI